MVNVEQRALCAFEKQALSSLLGGKQIAADIVDHRCDCRRERHGLVDHLLHGHGRGTQVLGQDEIMQIKDFFDLGAKSNRVEQVLHTQCATSDLVLVGRTNTAASGANLGLATTGFTGLIQCHVIRQNQRTGFGNLQARTHIQAGGLEFGDFF